MMGYCANCHTKIFRFKEGRIERPLGNYRSIKFSMGDGGSVEAPFCIDCHDMMTDDKIMEFQDKLVQYVRESGMRKDLIDRIVSSINLTGIKRKMGCLSKLDQEEGIIWQ